MPSPVAIGMVVGLCSAVLADLVQHLGGKLTFRSRVGNEVSYSAAAAPRAMSSRFAGGRRPA
jgi:hypothetical protein